MKISSEKPISIVYDALNVSKGLDVVGGASTQNYYAESKVFVPDRYIVPITLQPTLYITDPNGIIPMGNKASEFHKIRWFENGELITYGTDYKLNEKNELVVYKNSEKDLEITFEAEWLDKRKNQIVYVEGSCLLVCISLAESEGSARLVLDKPQNWVHNPFKGEREYTIKATLFASGEEAPLNSKWYIGGVPAEQDLSFVSQTNNTLVVDSNVIDTDIIECKVGELVAETKFIRKFPDKLNVNFIAPRKVRSGDTTVKAIARVIHRDGIIENPSEYFYVTWHSKKNISGATYSEIGRGDSITLSVSEFQTLRVDMESLGAFKASIDNADNELTDENGNIIILR